MSFIGALPQTARKVLLGQAKEIIHPVLVVGVGNFTIPAVLRSGGYTGEITACDVSIHACALGAYLSDSPLRVRERQDCPEQLRGLLRPDNPLDLAASVALILDLRLIWGAKNPFQQRMLNHYREKWEALLDRTRASLVALREHLGPLRFAARCGHEMLDAAPDETSVYIYPSNQSKGSGQEKKLIAAVLEWEQPPYKELNYKSVDFFKKLQRVDQYCVVLKKTLPHVTEVLAEHQACISLGKGRTIEIFGKNLCRRKPVLRKVLDTQDIGPVLPYGVALNRQGKLTLALITMWQSLRFNELFLSTRINYFEGGVPLSLAVCLGGQAIGKADFCPWSQYMPFSAEGFGVYLMSDLAVPSIEPRLSKLVLLALLSREARAIVDHHLNGRHDFVGTTAFTKGPVSMKYRGIFRLYQRKETPDGFAINYQAPFSDLTLADSLALWQKKYDKNRK